MTTNLESHVKNTLARELETLRDDVKQLADPLSDDQFWTRPTEPGNSVAHLCLHLTGNLNHFVGAQLGGTGYVRDRPREFAESQRLPKAQVLAGLDEAVATFRSVVEGLDSPRLASPHPESRFGTVLDALVHLLAHFALHRGQISYIVRLVKK